jgi:hypothetical protein
MEWYPMLVSDPGNFGNWLNGSDLVVRMHYGDEYGLRRDGAAYVIRIDAPKGVDRYESDPCAKLFEKLARVKNGRVFNLASDDVRVGCGGPQRRCPSKRGCLLRSLRL